MAAPPRRKIAVQDQWTTAQIKFTVVQPQPDSASEVPEETAAETTDLLYFNGINGTNGDYGLPPMTREALADFIREERAPENFDELEDRHKHKNIREYGVKEGVDANKVEEAGWGVIFPAGFDPAIKEALQPLLEWRRGQAGAYYRCYDGAETGPDGTPLEPYHPGDSSLEFLERNRIGPGPADPEKIPYYLLLVGSPAEVPYVFQYHLGVRYAVGRIHFDTIEAYANYARSVVAAETGQVRLPRQLSFFGPTHNQDPATQKSRRHLLEPLFKQFNEKSGWKVNLFSDEQASKVQFSQLLGGDLTPALLFATGHGLEFPAGDPRQRAHQGALLCQDWPGPQAWRGQGPIPPDFYFAADDLPSDANLLGAITFFFASFGVSTPLTDALSAQTLTASPFLADLPTRLLSHPQGGALAVIGQAGRVWGYASSGSKRGEGFEAQTSAFAVTLDRLLDGYPVGFALENFKDRYAALAIALYNEIEEMDFGKQVDPGRLVELWTDGNDLHNLIIIGDPAVRLAVAPIGETSLEQSEPTPVADNEANLKEFLQKLHKNTNLLMEREAEYGSDEAPVKLLNQIENYNTAISLTEAALNDELSLDEFQTELDSLIPYLGDDASVLEDRKDSGNLLQSLRNFFRGG